MVPFGFDVLAARYDVIETIAGTGTARENGFNGWVATMEGGPATSAELSRPHIALADDAGNVYVADKNAHAIRKIDRSGVITTVAGTNVIGDDGDDAAPATARRLANPNGLWVRGDGTLYVYDFGNDKVRRVGTDGTMTTMFVVGGSGAGRGLWVRDDEQLAYVSAGTLLKRWTPDNGVEVLANGFVALGNVHVAPDGRVLVADRGGHRVYEIGAGGEKTAIAGNGTTAGEGDVATSVGLNEVRGVWAHPEGGFFVCTHKGGQVWFVDPDGRIHLFVDGDTDHTHAGDGKSYAAPGPKISEPRAVTMTPSGDVLITENDYGYVRRVRLKN